MSNNGLVLYGWPQQRGLAFGLPVKQTAPVRYLDTTIPCGASFNNPVSDGHFKQVPASAIYSQESEQGEPIDLSHRPGAYRQADQNTKILTVQPEIRIDRVWSVGDEANAYLYSINANHTAPASTLKDTAVNESNVKASTSGSGESLTISHDKTYQKAYAQSEKREATRKAYREPDKGRVCRQTQTRSEKRKASQKAYAHSERGKATRKAYDQSEKRKAAQKINNKTYNKSEKGKAVRWAYENSEKRKACQRGYQKVYQKAYYHVFKNTGDRERARIAAKQAIALKRESDKTKNNELSN
ncbi:hypothetical protein [Endozoicomonas acroporae]|uniref:hypothetical protein n=1 Tax=Endozoicomonas acroporae TaxID=1701104 RepID=UPI003D7B7DBF